MIHQPIPTRPIPLGYRRHLAWLIRSMGKYDILGVEVGVAGGNLSYYLLNRLPGLRLYMADPWREVPANDSYRQSGSGMASRQQDWWEGMFGRACKVAEKFPGRGLIMRMRSLDLAGLFQGRLQPDFVFLDGDHSEKGINADLAAWWDVLRPGGLLAGHDYGRPRFPAVKPAVDAFAHAHGLELRFERKVWSLWKPEG